MKSTEEQDEIYPTTPEPDPNYGSTPTSNDGSIVTQSTPKPGNQIKYPRPENSKRTSSNETPLAKNAAKTPTDVLDIYPENTSEEKPLALTSSHPLLTTFVPDESSKKCRLSHTYSTISTPFLAGGEIKLPNIFSAVLKCGANLADSIKNWNKEFEPCNETESFSLIQLKTPPQPNKKTSTAATSSFSKKDTSPNPPDNTEAKTIGITKHQATNSKLSFVPSNQTEHPNNVAPFPTKQVLTTVSSTEVVLMSNELNLEPYKPQNLHTDRDLKEKNKGRGRKESNNQFPLTKPTSALSIHPVAAEVNLSYLKRNSMAVVPEGISGFRNLFNDRSNGRAQGSQVDSDSFNKDFVDLFTEKNCGKFITALENIESHYQRKVASETKAMQAPLASESESMLLQIKALTKITAVENERELHDYDFPLTLAHDVAKFNVDESRKLEAVLKLHNYGVKMILHWIYLLQDRVSIPPETICSVGTELLASIMIPCYGIFVAIGEHVMEMTDGSALNLNIVPLDKLLLHFRNLMDTISDELGAIGESGVQILIRTPNVTRERVEENIKRLYLQVNYAEIALSRAMEALVPLIHSYAIAKLSKNKGKVT